MADRADKSEGGIAALGEVLIPAINRVQDAFAAAGGLTFQLDLPQVAVVGSQSSGKSSVLESLVGRDFLPRGPDICTRRPLVLQLVGFRSEKEEDVKLKLQATREVHSSKGDEYGEFLHLPGETFTNFGKIRDEIEAETNRGAGSGKSISNVPIRLKIVSPHVLTMTLVDLPGITRVPVGNQPKDIEQRIRSMIMEYIKHQSCVILAVSPANSDLANSDALTLAKEVDPEGSRTIGVLTKLDIMDRGTNALAALENKVVPLMLGYIGVVNRCQADINAGMDIRSAREAERKFFVQSEEYSSVASVCGTINLAKRLNEILVRHIHKILPRLKRQIEFAREENFHRLQSLGDWSQSDSKSSQGALLLKMLTEYSQLFGNHLDGQDGNLPANEVAGGARIRHIFQNIFVKELKGVDPAITLTDKEIQTAIVNCSGIKGSLLMPEIPFQLLARRLIENLLEPCLQCSRFVCEEMIHIARRCEPERMNMLPNLQSNLRSAVQSYIEECLAPTEDMVTNLVNCELAHINTSHPDFIGGSQAIATILEQKKCFVEKSKKKFEEDSHSLRQSMSTPFKMKPLEEAEIMGESKTLNSDLKKRKQEEGGAGERQTGWIASIFGAGGAHKATPEAIYLQEPPKVLRVSETKNEQEALEVEVTRLLVSSYFGIVSKTLQDMIPKVVVHFMVNSVKSGLQKRLVQLLYKEELFASLTTEHSEVASKREQCQRTLKFLHIASHTLESIPKVLDQSSSGLGSRPSGSAGGGRVARRVSPKRNRNDFTSNENSHPNIKSPQSSSQRKSSSGPLGRGLASVISR